MSRNEPKTAEEIMSRRVLALSPTAPVEEAAHTLLRRGYSGAPVTDEAGKVQGVFSEADSVRVLSQAVYEGWPGGTVAGHMTTELDTVRPDADLPQVASRFVESKHRRLLVVDDDNTVVGIITRSDLLRALDRMLEPERAPTTYELIGRNR